MSDADLKANTPKATLTYLRLLAYIKPFKRQLVYAIAGMIGYAITEACFALLMKPLLDVGFVERDDQAILLVPMLIILIFIVRGIAGFSSTYFMSWIGWSVIKQLRKEVFAKYLTLPTRFYDNASSGELISRITFNSQRVAQAASTTLTIMVRDTLTVIGLFVVMFYHSWELSLCFLVIGPIIGIIVDRVSRKFRAVSHQIQDSMGEVSHAIQEAVDGSRVIKIFGGQATEKMQFELVNERNRDSNMRETAIRALNVPVIQMLVAIALAIIVYVATSGNLAERLTVGEFMSFVTAMLLLFQPMRRLTSLNNQIQNGIAAVESLFATLDLASEKDTGTEELKPPIKTIEYKSVRLQYLPDKPAVLHNIDLRIASGETIAFVGESGSGKTSLVNLLPRLYEMNGGTIEINSKSITDYTLSSLRDSIAYVSQDVMLFNDTIANNIAYGSKKTVSQEELKDACKTAHAHEFIMGFADQYDTMVGENGVMLSGGQRQRVAIARAILKNAPILILDEATSALDTESERKVQQGLHSMMQNRTTLVVAHRLSTIERADMIIVMDNGEVVETGTHSELLARNTHYSRLHQLHAENH